MHPRESPYYSPRVRIKQDPKEKKKKENRRQYAKIKTRKERERYFDDLKIKDVGVRDQKKDLEDKLAWAKDRIFEFMQRTKRTIDFDQLHSMNQIAGRRTTDFLPGGSSLVLTFDAPGRKRKGLNREKAQKVAQKMRIPFWREMQADELRAALIILIHKEGIDMFGRPVE